MEERINNTPAVITQSGSVKKSALSVKPDFHLAKKDEEA